MSDTVRRVGDLFWTRAGSEWEVWHAGGQWLMFSRRDGRVSQKGWYLRPAGVAHATHFAGSRIEQALRIATLIVLGEWSRTGLREPDGTPTWLSAAGDQWREPDLLATLEVRRG